MHLRFFTWLPLTLLALLLPCSLSFDHARLYAVASPPPTYQAEFIPLQNVKQVAVGWEHTCALTTNGSVLCWGSNNYGQLGDGTMVTKSTPVTVLGLSSGVAAITTGGYYTCALTTTGVVKCWGNNEYGQLGDGTTMNRSTPVVVNRLTSDVAAISASGTKYTLFLGSHTCALTTAGSVLCWGYNANGQLGDGTTINRNSPVAVSGLNSGIVAITVGEYHTCARAQAGNVLCWGDNYNGQLGDGTSGNNKNTPVEVVGLSNRAETISAGWAHTCALTTTGNVLCWGHNYYGQVGDGSMINRNLPTAVAGLSSGIQAIASGGFQTCALKTSGSVFCWGANDYGQLGDGTTVQKYSPAMISGLDSGIQSIASGGGHTCALTTTGNVLCWGANFSGQLGHGTEILKNKLVIGLNNGVEAITAGSTHTCILADTNGVYCWGDNYYGELGDGSTMNKSIPVAVQSLGSDIQAIATGNGHTCALTTNGGVRCWGDNRGGQLGDGTAGNIKTIPVAVTGLSSGVRAIATGSGHTCALTASGVVRCWGYNYRGQLGDGSTVNQSTPITVTGLSNGVQAIDAGGDHTCALTTVGNVLCWGNNLFGQLGDGSTVNQSTPVTVVGLNSNIQAIATGSNHTCALTMSGGVHCWGSGQSGNIPMAVIGLNSSVQAIAAGDSHTCALTTSGSVFCWGYNYRGQLGDGSTVNQSTPIAVPGLSSGVQAIAAGGNHTCVLTTVGETYCWGDNRYGQLGDGSAWHTIPGNVIIEAKADLAIANIVIEEVGIPTCGSTAYSLPRVARVTVRNDGLVAAGAFVVSVNNIVTRTVTTGIAAGATTLVEFDSGFQNGANTVNLDLDNQVEEQDESNNTFTKDIWMPMATPIPTCTPTPPSTDTPTPTVTPTPTPPANALKKWTMMLYLAGDTGRIDGGTVFGELRKAVRRLENAPNPDVNVVALLDGPNDLDSFRETFTPQLHDTPVGEMPMDDPLTLVNFVKQAQHEFPAEHYYLVIADHANGVQGIGWDTTTAPNKTALLTPAKLAQAFQQMSEDGAAPIDVVHFDGCSFGLLENMATMRNYARYLVMSQNIGWSVFAYDQYRAALTATTSPDAFAKTVARLYGQIVRAKELPYTISAIDLSQLDAVLPALNGLADALRTYIGNDASRRATVTAARAQSQKFDSTRPLFEITNDDWYVDLVDFAINVQTQIADPPLSMAANHLIATVKTGPTPLVIYESHLTASIVQNSTDNCPDGELWQLDNANGVSLYFPPRTGSSEFTHYSSGDTFTYFTTQSHWDEFLQGGVPPLAPGDPPPDDAPIPLAHCSVTDAQTATEKQLFLPIVRR